MVKGGVCSLDVKVVSSVFYVLKTFDGKLRKHFKIIYLWKLFELASYKNVFFEN